MGELRGQRVLFVLTQALDPNSGGVQMSTWKLGSYFSSKGADVAVFSFAPHGHKKQDFAYLCTGEAPGGERSRINLDCLARFIRVFRPTVVINQMPYEHQIGEVLTRDKSYLLIGCLRNTLYSVRANLEAYANGLLPSWLQPLARSAPGRAGLLAVHRRRHRKDLEQILKNYDYFVMFGPPNLEELRYFVPGYDPAKIKLIPNSIPHVADVVPLKENRILWLGRVSHLQKRADLILEVWKQVSEKLPDWSLDIVGDGPALGDIKRAVVEGGIPRVDIHGRQVPDPFYSRASIFFMTSTFEGFPNTLVEAQSYGAIPVLFNSYPIAQWIIQSDDVGVLVPPLDVKAMSDRIIEIAKDPNRDGLAEASLKNAKRFGIEQVGAKWLALLAEGDRYRAQSVNGPGSGHLR
ncbi:MAG: glycosyltransferase [Gammaproteobacteria bacterium]